MKRPLCLFVIHFIAGIICGQYITPFVAIALFFISICLLSVLIYFRTKALESFLCVIFFAIGFVLLQNALLPKYDLLEVEQNESQLYGYIISSSATQSGGMKAVMQIVTGNDIPVNRYILLPKMKVIAYFDQSYEYSPTQLIAVTGTLQKPSHRTNPGGFSQYFYYKTRGIAYTLYADSFNETGVENVSIFSLLNKLKKKIATIYDTVLPASEAGIVKGMILGDTSSIDSEIAALYNNAGISHIIAISGMHLSLISFFIYTVCIELKMRKNTASLITIGLLAIYTIFTGAPISAVRSFIMVTCMLFANIIYRKADIYTSLAFSALIQLIFQPLFLWDAGFQLSYSAVLGILLFSKISDKFVFIPKILRNMLFPTIGATLVTLPIILYHFHIVSVFSAIINIIVVPFSSLVLAVSFIIGLVGLFSIPFAMYFSGVVYFVLRFYYECSRFFTDFPISIITPGQPNILAVIIFYLFILFSSYCVFMHCSLKAKLKRFAVGFILSVVAIVILFILPKDFEVIFLDVGQGDSTVIHTPENKTILIDGGGNRNRFENKLSNTGEFIILPFLKYKGITQLDAVFISHFDADHIIGVLEVLEHVKTEVIYISPLITQREDTNSRDFYNRLIYLAERYKIPIKVLHRGLQISIDNIDIMCLSPFENAYTTQNNNSLVLSVEYDSVKLLFTGDIERQAEESILQTDYEALDSDILKVAHHGSKTSSAANFIDAVSPDVAVISCSKNNSYGHPHPNTLENLFPTKIWTTANEGAVICTIKNGDFKMDSVLNKERSKYERVKK